MEHLDLEFFKNLDLDYKNPSHLMWKKMMLLLEHVKPGGALIDVGCGTGEFMIQLRNRFDSLVGVDVNSNAIAFASKKVEAYSNVSLYEGEVNTFHFPSRHFDVCLCLDVLEHVENLFSFLKEIYRILRPNGELFVTVPNWYDKIISGTLKRNPFHLNTFTPWTWMRCLRKAGFELKYYRAVEFPILQWDLLARKIYFLGMCIFIVGVRSSDPNPGQREGYWSQQKTS